MIYPVILSGGSGTRLWPLSRAMFPKQFIAFFGGESGSLLGTALGRLRGDNFGAPTLLCNNDHRFLIRETLEELGVEARSIILEPVARNTAPAIAVAVQHIVDKDPDAVVAVMPSDHLIKNTPAFVAAVERAAEVARAGRLVLFGIKPDEPHTGYGYIRQGGDIAGAGQKAFEVAAFREKPDRETAERYVTSGDHFWNSGIFVLHGQTFLDEMARFEPTALDAAKAALSAATLDFEFLRLDEMAFAAAPNISVDYAVMERTDKAALIPVDLGWSDVGSWSSLWAVSEHDSDGNAATGDTLLKDTHNSYVHSERSLVATIGVDNLVVVDTPDALLVADKSRAQEVSGLVASLRDSGRKETEQHLRNLRPWGYFETLALGPRFQVKKLHVKPGGKLSMQRHHHRSEHWVVVQGTAQVSIGDTTKLVRENESVYIFATQWHRLENPGKVPLEVIEVQIGTYLGEDDIERSDDIYNRAEDETR
ncbi:MAG: mannose-1-phosphate guanylyltransferase/mannose-6-phosphate isomerase [Pseudomonadota bacterium]